MKYIVTGAAGLIGGAVVSALNEQGETDILAVDHLGTSEKWMNLRPLQFSDYLEKDLFRRRLNEGAFRDCGIEAIIHMGACSATTERDASYLADNNFNVTKELAEFAVRNNIRFPHASSLPLPWSSSSSPRPVSSRQRKPVCGISGPLHGNRQPCSVCARFVVASLVNAL